MKYDILKEFKEYLESTLSVNTAKKYYSSVKGLLSDLDFNRVEQIPENIILERVRQLKSKNEVSAAKNGLLNLKKIYPNLQLPNEKEFTEIAAHKRNWVKSQGREVNLDDTLRKINSLHNSKLKLAYRLALISGLRVSELAALVPKDIKFNENGTLELNVRHGKGGKNDYICCYPDNYVYERLKTACTQSSGEEKLFYSASHMRKKMWELGLQMHDFRRAFSMIKKNSYINDGCTLNEANEKVKTDLRHARFSTTKRYLYGRKITTTNKKYKVKRKVPEKKNEEVKPDPIFKSINDMDYMMWSVSDAFDLSQTEKDALEYYTSGMSSQINRTLYDKTFHIGEDDRSGLERIVKTISEFIERKTIPQDIIAYRGIPDGESIFNTSLKDMTINEIQDKYSGMIISNEGFSSFTSLEHIAEIFADKIDAKDKIIMIAEIPKGFKGVAMGEITQYKEEKEVLLQKDSFFYINKIEKDKDNYFMNVHVRLIAQKKVK